MDVPIREQMSGPGISWYVKSILGCGLSWNVGKKGLGRLWATFEAHFFTFSGSKKNLKNCKFIEVGKRLLWAILWPWLIYRGFPWVPMDYFIWVLVGSRRFWLIYLVKMIITIASYRLLSQITWLLYREGSRGFPWTLLHGISWVPEILINIFSKHID